ADRDTESEAGWGNPQFQAVGRVAFGWEIPSPNPDASVVGSCTVPTTSLVSAELRHGGGGAPPLPHTRQLLQTPRAFAETRTLAASSNHLFSLDIGATSQQLRDNVIGSAWPGRRVGGGGERSPDPREGRHHVGPEQLA